jgi:tRNA(Arg) A34 adenosine deaminase TadA
MGVGLMDPWRAGAHAVLCAGGVEPGARFFAAPSCHHRPVVVGGVRAAAASALLRGFFAERR